MLRTLDFTHRVTALAVVAALVLIAVEAKLQQDVAGTALNLAGAGQTPTSAAKAGPAPLAAAVPLLQPTAGISVPGRPQACTSDLIKSISWGVAHSAYQIEGAYNESGKSMSIWDVFVRKPGKIKGGGTGDVAIDHYHRYKEDYKLMKGLGINMHRFSFNWARIVPQGFANTTINEDGVAFYHRIIDEMLANGITPVATIYHWDMPQALQDAYNGWMSERVIADFNYYALTLYASFGNKIKHWVTINEPPSICDHGYKSGIYAPGMKGGKKELYQCAHNVLLAHGVAARTYRKLYQPTQKGKVGFATNVVWAEPMTTKPEDVRAANNKLEREYGWLMDPLFFGDYPSVLKLAIASDLPSFTAEQKALLKGSVDFVGVNVYTARYVYAHPDNWYGFKETSKKDGKDIGDKGGATWLYNTPFALGGILRYVGERYGRPETWVTEFGTGINGENTWTGDQVLQDNYRTKFYSAYLDNACGAITKHKLNVTRFFAWSLFDNFEWAEGFEVRYGSVFVNFTTQERRVKESGYWWSQHFFRNSRKPT